MEKEEHEMSPEYHRNTELLLELLEKRAYCEKQLRDLPLNFTDEMKREKIEIDKSIEAFENALAEQYEAVQLQKRIEAKLNQTQTGLLQQTMEMYIAVKHKSPELAEGFEKLIYESFSPEDVEIYLDQVAIMEAARLDEILGRETTRE